MADDGYEVMGPTGGPPQPTITAFPTASAPAPPAPKTPVAKPPPAPAAPVAAAPPAPKNAVAKSVMDTEGDSVMAKEKKKSEAGKASKPSKKQKANASVAESVMENADGEGKAAYQRPNGCDMCQIAFIWFLLVIVIGVSIPVILAATKTAEIDYIFDKLTRMKKA